MEGILVTAFHTLSFLKTQCGRNPDYKVNKIIQSYSLYSNIPNEIRCPMCKESGVAVRYCKDCYSYIDKLCNDFHGKINHLREHKILDFTQGNLSLLDFVPKVFCDKTGHTKYELDTYCVNCNKLVCKRCIKHHVKRNHNLNSLTDLYQALSVVFEIKMSLQRSYDHLPNHPNYREKKRLLSTFVRWIDRTFDINCTDICESSDPSTVIEILQRDMRERGGANLSPATYCGHYVSCKSVLEKLKQIQSDLVNISVHGNTEKQQIENGGEIHREGSYLFSDVPYRTTEERTNQPREDEDNEDSSLSSLSSVDSSGSFHEINGVGSENSTDHGSMIIRQVEMNSEAHDKPVEEEIAILQAAQEDFSFSSFQDIHLQ